jgi:hypothetical protein
MFVMSFPCRPLPDQLSMKFLSLKFFSRFLKISPFRTVFTSSGNLFQLSTVLIQQKSIFWDISMSIIQIGQAFLLLALFLPCPVTEFVDPVFAKTSPKRGISLFNA